MTRSAYLCGFFNSAPILTFNFLDYILKFACSYVSVVDINTGRTHSPILWLWIVWEWASYREDCLVRRDSSYWYWSVKYVKRSRWLRD